MSLMKVPIFGFAKFKRVFLRPCPMVFSIKLSVKDEDLLIIPNSSVHKVCGMFPLPFEESHLVKHYAYPLKFAQK